MSRVIIKNLPKTTDEAKIREIFGTKGQITDVQLKYNKQGVFRSFAFVGFKSEDQAQAVQAYFNNNYIQTSRIKVEICQKEPKRQSQSTQDQNNEAHNSKNDQETDNAKSKTSKKFVHDEFSKMKEEDPDFNEFLQVQRNLGNQRRSIWSDEGMQVAQAGSKQAKSKDKNDDKAGKSMDKKINMNKEKNTLDASDTSNRTPAKKLSKAATNHPFTLAVRNIPKSKRNKTSIRAFFEPVHIANIRIPLIKCLAYVSFDNEKDLRAALLKHKSFLGKNQILLQLAKQTETACASTDEFVNPVPSNEDVGNNNFALRPNSNATLVFNKNKTRLEKHVPVESIEQSGRLFLRNLSYGCKQEDLEQLMSTYGPTTEIYMPIDETTDKPKGFAFITFMFPEHALKAFAELDRSQFQGRLLHVLPAEVKHDDAYNQYPGESSFKKRKAVELFENASRPQNWNALFLGANAVADLLSSKLNVKKSKLLFDDYGQKDSIAARVALGETQLVNETRRFLESNGVCLSAFEQMEQAKRSKTTILIKNLPANTTQEELSELINQYGKLSRLILPTSGVTAIAEMASASAAQVVFRKMAFYKFKRMPLYLEWAPINVFGDQSEEDQSEHAKTEADDKLNGRQEESELANEQESDQEEEPEANTVLYVKNLSNVTNATALRTHFSKCGRVHKATIAEKKGPDGTVASMGYGFVQFYHEKDAQTAIRKLELSKLDGSAINIKLSANPLSSQIDVLARSKKLKSAQQKKLESTKISVKNVPFEATEKDLEQLFRPFGQLQFVRLPKKLSGSGSHRGFGFIEFALKSDAKKAMESLSQSTHLYGRRLVLDWAKSDNSS